MSIARYSLFPFALVIIFYVFAMHCLIVTYIVEENQEEESFGRLIAICTVVIYREKARGRREFNIRQYLFLILCCLNNLAW